MLTTLQLRENKWKFPAGLFRTGGAFFSEFLGNFFFLSSSDLGAQIPKRPEKFSQSDLVVWVPEWPEISKKKRREVCGEAEQLQGIGLLAADFPRVRDGGL